MKTEFKSLSNINVKNGFTSSSNIKTDLDSTTTLDADFTSASNINAPPNDLNTNFLKLRLDTETGRYIEVDQEVGQDFITLHLRAAKGNILDSTTINITGGVRVTNLELTDNILIITNSDGQKVSCDLTPLLSDKVDRNPDIIGATKTKITYDSKGLVIGGTYLSASDIPSLPANKITENSAHRFVTDAEKNLWTSKSDFSGQYDDLENKPLINNVEIKGNITLEDLNINNFSGDYGDLSNKPIIPTKVSQLENDENFITKDYVDTIHFNLDEFIPEVGSSYWLSEADIINEVFFGDSVLFNTFVNKTVRISVFCDGGSGGGSDLFIYLTSTVSGDITRYTYQRVTPDNKTYTVSLIYSEIETGWKWLTSYDPNSGGGGSTNIPISSDEPEDKSSGSYWFKII